MNPEDPTLFDSRTLERKLRSGTISKKDYDRYVKGLSDVSGKAAPIQGEAGPEDGAERTDAGRR